MSMNREGRPTRPEAPEAEGAAGTWTGNRALMLEEPLLFEMGEDSGTGVDVEAAPKVANRLGGLERNRPIGLPGLSEPQAVRHYTRLSRQNYAIDLGLFPLGSCTMKHNPRLNERMARLPGFADIHPLQPIDTVQGALELIEELGGWLVKLTGMHSVAMSPKAGAHGELCGLLAIRAALEARGDAREARTPPRPLSWAFGWRASLPMRAGGSTSML
jgi:glycine dehydrogenase subunit 2